MNDEPESLPAEIRQRLRQARLQAIEDGLQQPPRRLPERFWVTATAAMLALLLTHRPLPQDDALAAGQADSAQQRSELLAEAEFYQWLSLTIEAG